MNFSINTIKLLFKIVNYIISSTISYIRYFLLFVLLDNKKDAYITIALNTRTIQNSTDSDAKPSNT